MPFTTAMPIASSSDRSRCQLRWPRTTNEPRASDSPVSAVFDTWLGLTWNAVAAAPPPPHALDQQTEICAASECNDSASPLASSNPSPRFWTICIEVTPSGTASDGFWLCDRPSLSLREHEGAPCKSAWTYRSFEVRCLRTTMSLPFASLPPMSRCPPESMAQRCFSNQKRLLLCLARSLPAAASFAARFSAFSSASSVPAKAA